MKPREDRILIEPDPVVDKIAGLVMGEKDREKPLTGTVIRVGPGRINHNIKLSISGDATPELLDRIQKLMETVHKPAGMDVAEGDRVMFGRYSGTRVKHQGREVLFIRAADVLSILEDGDEGFRPVRTA